jgi:hypothetical protein
MTEDSLAWAPQSHAVLGETPHLSRYEDKFGVVDDRWIIRHRESRPICRRRTENKLEMVSRG